MSEKKADEGRRNFLKLAGVSAPAAAAMATMTPQEVEAAELEAAGEGLRKTEHVKTYLETARF